MSAVFHFRCLTPCFPRNDAVLVLFAGPTPYNRNALTDAVTQETRKMLSPEAAYLLYPTDIAALAAADLVDNMDVFAPLAEDSTIGIYAYDEKGNIGLAHVLRGTPPEDLPLEFLRRQGMTTLFRRHGGALDAGPTAHFVRPSSRPSTRFLRAAHALSDGVDIFFAAFCLLPHLPDDIDYIHIDTSAIASVVLAALALRKVGRHPVILTFHSYRNMEQHPFSVDRADLVLISASQSGSMAEDIRKYVADGRRILTLFSSADAPGDSHVICDIRYDSEINAMGFKPARDPGDVKRTRPIRLISEHFTVEPEPPRAIVPTIHHVPDVVKKLLAPCAGHKALLALRATDLGDERISLWIDMEALSGLDIFRAWVERLVNQAIPSTLQAIVQIEEDDASGRLAEAIFDAAKRHGRPLDGITRLTLSDLEKEDRKWPEPGSPVVVTGATAGRGTQLLAASRALRRFAPESHRVFLAPGAIGLSTTSIELLRRNLVQPTYRFETMFELILDREACAQSWSEERMLLEDLDRGDIPEAVEARILSLNGYPQGRCDGLFLAAPANELALRDNFAFWPKGTPCTLASHADVFTTVCAIMEHLRSDATAIEQRLINDVQTHTVLSVETFSRYNDGVIQASFLRSARPIELNYKDTPAESRLMLDLLRQMIRYRDRQQGEALAEFLLAVACGRLRLVDEDFEKLQADLAAGLVGASDITIWLAAQIARHKDRLPL